VTRAGRATVPVLVVEDDASMAKLIRHLLELDGYQQIRHVYTGEQAVTAAAGAEIILLDHQLPDTKGIDLLPRLINRPEPPAVVLVTAHGSESLAAAALRQGAEDYVTKDHTLPELLPRILERVRRNRALQATLADAERALVESERLAATGEMTVTLHHELNNPLMAAMAEVELLLGDPTFPEALRDGMVTAKAALDRVAAILRQAADLRRAETLPYAGGLRMTDLAPGDAAEAPAYQGRALLFHPEQRVVRILSLLCRKAGFVEQRPASIADLQHAAGDAGVSVVFLPGGNDPADPLGGFVPPESRDYAVVVLGSDYAPRCRGAGADHVVALPFDPATVITDVLGVIEARPPAPRRIS
jgi:DNA-binding response OmpR family regulator